MFLYIQVIHLLLDLPCITASLQMCRQAERSRAATVDSSPASASSPAQEAAASRKDLAAFTSTENRPLFKFILRVEAGFGDTINKLEVVHRVLEDVARKHVRVRTCAEVMPQLLQ